MGFVIISMSLMVRVSLILLVSVNGRFIVEKSSISVLSPDNLRSKHDSAIGNFGIPDYGGTMIGNIVYPSDKSSATGCNPFDGVNPFKSHSSSGPIFLLLDRGVGCPYSNKKCMGDPEVDVDNPVLKIEQDLQIGRGSRGDVTILPTLVINNAQYRGKLERTSVLKAVCAGFKETSDLPICLSGAIETNECLENNGGCWRDPRSNVTACKDMFRGRICQCPVVNGVQYRGDGYRSCEGVGPARCTMNNGGCWSESRNGLTVSACAEFQLTGCRCPSGFRGDGQKCEDIDECKESRACRCDGCTCKNPWGGYDCKCKGDSLYILEQDTCIGRDSSRFGWFLTLLVVSGVVGAGMAGYIFYKYRLRSYMDSEIMAIMSQYMPLDNQQNEVQPLQQAVSTV